MTVGSPQGVAVATPWGEPWVEPVSYWPCGAAWAFFSSFLQFRGLWILFGGSGWLTKEEKPSIIETG